MMLNNLNTSSFAKKINYSRCYVHMWMNGRNPGKKALNHLDKFFKSVNADLKLPEDLKD